MRTVLFITLILVTCNACAQRVKIGIFQNEQFSKCLFSARGEYQVIADGEVIFTMKPNQVADIYNAGGKISLWFSGKSWKFYNEVRFSPVENNTQFALQPNGIKKNNRLYEGELVARSGENGLRLINEIDIEHYVAGVIEAEAGSGELLEYYKVQAIISRTYALNNLRKHEAEGFHLCDATHCQVYHGLPRREDLAIAAVAETKEMVIVDSDINLITAAFHSNCGGQTVNAGDVWSKHLPYLVSRPDSFCISMPSAHWEKCFSIAEWEEYLDKKTVTYSGEMASVNPRAMYVVDSCAIIPTRMMRHDLNLRSTRFDVEKKEDKINLIGYGFGHGVGLCQEGAMQMAKRGYLFSDIIHFYYRDVHIIPLSSLGFFQEESLRD